MLLKKRTFPYYKGQYYSQVDMAWLDIQKSFTTRALALDHMNRLRSFGKGMDTDCGIRIVKISKTDRSFYTAV